MARYLLKKIPIFLLLVILIVFPIPLRGTVPYPIFHKGMTYVTWSKEGFAGLKSDESLKNMAEVGVNCVAIVPTWYQEKYNSLEMAPTERTPSDSSLRHAIRKAREYGMLVMLKPHIDLMDQGDACRSDIGFQKEEDWQIWFSNYAKFINHYARIAEEEKAEFFCVGTELSFAATRTEAWKNDIIPGVRKIFSGQITYAANWDEYQSVGFWDEMDYAGIDAYFPLAKNSNPSYDEIRVGWKRWLGEIEKWQCKIKMPIVFTECGYCSSDSAAMKPWEEAMAGKPNMYRQADCYRALFETFWQKPWFFGVYWWNWNTYSGSGGPNNRRFTPQNKIAAEYIKRWYSQIIDKKMVLADKGGVNTANIEFEERQRLEDLKESQRYGDTEKRIIFEGNLAPKDRQKIDRPR